MGAIVKNYRRENLNNNNYISIQSVQKQQNYNSVEDNTTEDRGFWLRDRENFVKVYIVIYHFMYYCYYSIKIIKILYFIQQIPTDSRPPNMKLKTYVVHSDINSSGADLA